MKNFLKKRYGPSAKKKNKKLEFSLDITFHAIECGVPTSPGLLYARISVQVKNLLF